MIIQPSLLFDIDNDPADPLNPSADNSHFRPSAEQQDPHVPLGFKIYGVGCLVIFLLAIALGTFYVIYKTFIKREHEAKGKGNMMLEKPSLPSSIYEVDNYSNDVEGTRYSRPLGDNAHGELDRPKEGSWDSASTVVNDRERASRLPPSCPGVHDHSGLGSPNPFDSFPAAQFPFSAQESTFPGRPGSPISPKTVSTQLPRRISPISPSQVYDFGQVHNSSAHLGTASRTLGINESPGSDTSERRSSSPPKGILKTSPTFVARKTSVSPSSVSSPMRRASAPEQDNIQRRHNRAVPEETVRTLRAMYQDRLPATLKASLPAEKFLPPIAGRRNWQKEKEEVKKVFKKVARPEDQFLPPIAGRRKPSIVASPVPTNVADSEELFRLSVNSGQDSSIVYLGPEASKIPGFPSRRVSLSIPRRYKDSIAEPRKVSTLIPSEHRNHKDFEEVSHSFAPPVAGRRKQSFEFEHV